MDAEVKATGLDKLFLYARMTLDRTCQAGLAPRMLVGVPVGPFLLFSVSISVCSHRGVQMLSTDTLNFCVSKVYSSCSITMLASRACHALMTRHSQGSYSELRSWLELLYSVPELMHQYQCDRSAPVN